MNTMRISNYIAAVVLGLSSFAANSTPVLDRYAFNVNGATTLGAVPAGFDISAFDFSTGLGSITLSINGSGSHTFDAIFDHDIDESINTFFNETGSVTGIAVAGQSWEIDEPLGGDSSTLTTLRPYAGDIFGNFLNSSLDNQIFSGGIGTSNSSGDDVSMAMGWDFDLGLDETAFITLLLSKTDYGNGIYLTQSDPGSGTKFYFSSTLDIRDVPEPSIILLFGTGLLGLVAIRRKTRGRI